MNTNSNTNADIIVWDFFDRAEGKNFSKSDSRMLSFALPASLTLEAALAAARSDRDITGTRSLGKGSARSGCFQVQNGAGIWQHINDAKIDLSTHKKAALVAFKTWDEMEADEIAFGEVRWS